jgi:hypothetical protein
MMSGGVPCTAMGLAQIVLLDSVLAGREPAAVDTETGVRSVFGDIIEWLIRLHNELHTFAPRGSPIGCGCTAGPSGYQNNPSA